MALAPGDELEQSLLERNAGVETDLLARLFGRSYPVADQSSLAARRVGDFLLATGQRDEHLGKFPERGALAGPHVVKPVDHFGLHRADIGPPAVLNCDKVERLAPVAE